MGLLKRKAKALVTKYESISFVCVGAQEGWGGGGEVESGRYCESLLVGHDTQL